MIVGVPVSLAFMCVVIGSQVLLQYVNWEKGAANSDDGTNTVPLYWKYLPGVINSILIIVFGKIYVWLAGILV